MSFINHRLSRRVAYGFEGGPEWNTRIIELDNGMEVRNGQWAYPRHRYSAQYVHLDETARNAVIHAFHAARGRLYAFRFQDWNDYQANDEILYVKPGTRTPVQLSKTYRMGNVASVRPVRAIVTATVVNSHNDSIPGHLDSALGVFTPDNEWDNDSYTWNGEFDVWVRFDSDYNAFAISSRNGQELIATASIDLIEVKR